MANVEIEILDSDNSIQGVLEVGDTKNFPLSLTSSLSNLRDISERSGSFSTSFKIPSTKDNDNLLEHLYLSQEKNYKDFDEDKDAVIRVDGLDIEKGKLRISRIKVGGRSKATDYTFKFFGNNMDWVLKMKGNTTSDLSYLDTTLTFSDADIQTTWLSTGGSDLPVYSLLNRGERQDNDEVNIKDMRPDYFAIDYMESAFKDIGYNFESTYFNQVDQKDLMLTFFGDNFRLRARQELNTANVQLDTSVTSFDTTFTHTTGNSFNVLAEIEENTTNQCDTFTAHLSSSVPIMCDTSSLGSNYSDTPSPLKDDGGNYASNQYTVPFSSKYQMSIIVDYSIFYNPNDPQLQKNIDYKMKFTRGVTEQFATLLPYTTQQVTTTTHSANWVEERIVQGYSTNWTNLIAGDILELFYIYITKYNAPAPRPTDSFHQKLIQHPTILSIRPDDAIEEDDDFNWGASSDDKIEQLSIITDIAKIHNAIFRTNPATRTVYLEPRDDFYNALSTAENWTDKIDTNNQYTITYNSAFYKRTQVFDYAKDDNDGYLNERNKENGDNWLSYTHSYPDKFVEGTTTLKTKVLAATHTLEDIYSGGNASIFTSRIWKDKDEISPLSTLFAPRLLYYKYGVQQTMDGTSRDWQWRDEATKRTLVPYAMAIPVIEEAVTMADLPDTLSFKEVQGLDGLWYDHFSSTTTEIEEGKRLEINLLFDLVDYNNLDFRKPIYFDNRFTEIEGYWRVEKVKAFKPSSGAISVAFELIQAKNYQRAAVNPLTGSPTAETGNDRNNPRYQSQLGGGGGNESGERSAFRETSQSGFDNNVKSGGNCVSGKGLVSSGSRQVISGVNNVDVSTDIFNLGTGGNAGDRYSLIRVSEDGKTYFNGRVVRGGDLMLDVSSNLTADLEILTYKGDASGGDFTITLPVGEDDVKMGDFWHIKKMTNSGKITLETEDPATNLIDGNASVTINMKNLTLTPQWDGANYIII